MKTKVLSVLTIINLIIVGFCLVGCLYIINTSDNISLIADSVVEIIASIAAITYFAKGAKKNAAKYYKMFMLFEASTFVIEYLFSLLGDISNPMPLVNVFSIILFGTTLLLAVAKDMGKRLTISLAGFNFAVYIAGLISAIIKHSLDNPVYMIMTATWLAISGLTLIMTIAKYIDKESRNAK